MEKLIGYSTAMGEISREQGNQLGNRLKTVLSRITTMDESVSALADIGISTTIGEEVRDVSDILDDLGEKWHELSNAQKQHISVQLAGRHQLSGFTILMENYDRALEATETALDSNGSAMKENERYLDSYEAKINKMKNAWTETTLELEKAALGNIMDTFMSSATGGIKALTFLIEHLGVIPIVAGTATLGISAFSHKLDALSTTKIATTFNQFKESFEGTNAAANVYATRMTTANLATRALANSMKALRAVAVPLLVVGVVTTFISKLTEAYNKNKEAAERLKKQMEDLQETNQKAVTVNKQEVDSLLNSYHAMSEARPDGGFEDIDREKEYLRIQNELAEVFPAIVSHIDSKGQAHLKAADGIREEIEQAEKLLEIERNLAISKADETYKEDLKNYKTQEKEISSLEKRRQQVEKILGQGFHSDKVTKDYQKELEQLEQQIKIQQMGLHAYVNSLSQSALDTFQKMTHELQNEAPEIANIFDRIFSATDFTGMNPREIEGVTLELKEMAEELDYLFASGREEEFNESLERLNSFLTKTLKFDKVDLLDLSFKRLVDTQGKSAELAQLFSGAMEDAEGALEGASEATSILTEEQEKLAKSFDSSVGSIESLNQILEELDEGNGMSAKSMSTLMESYPQLLPYLEDEAELRKRINETIEEQAESAEHAMNEQIDSLQEQLMADEDYVRYVEENNSELVNFLSDQYQIDLKNFTSLAKAKEDIENQLLESLTEKWNQYIDGAKLSVKEMANLVGSDGVLTDQGRTRMSELGQQSWDAYRKGDLKTANYYAKQQEQMGYALGRHQQEVKEMEEAFDKVTKIDFDKTSTNFNSLGKNIRKAGKSAKKSAKDIESSTYVADQYKLTLERLNLELEKLNSIQSKYPQHSKQFINALKDEAEVLKLKQDAIEGQTKALQEQIKAGKIQETGVITTKTPGSGADSSIADYYKNTFRTPTAGQRYGMRVHPITGEKKFHKGVDLANGREGDLVKAVRGGKVVTATYSKTAGNWVIIQQDDGTTAKYMHMQSGLNVRAGQNISAGQTLGKVGNTGSSTGAHLHLQIEQDGKTIDPTKYLNSASGTADLSKEVAQSQSNIDNAKSEVMGLQAEAIRNKDAIEEIYFQIVEAQLSAFDHAREQLETNLAKIDYYQTRYDELSPKWVTQQLQREKILKQQANIHKDSIKHLEKEIKTNKNLGEAQRMRLDDLLNDKQKEMWDLERQVLEERISMTDRLLDVYKQSLEAQKEAALKSVDDMIKEIDDREREADYKKQLDKTQSSRQDILDEISEWSIDDSDAAKKRIQELTTQLQELDEEISEMQHDKGIEDEKAALESEKESISERFDGLVNDEQKFADMRSNIINGNTKSIKKQLDKFYKDIGKLTDELGKTAVKNLQASIKQMSGYVGKSSGVSIPRFNTGGMVHVGSKSGGIGIVDDKELILKESDTKNFLKALDITRGLSKYLTPQRPRGMELAGVGGTTNNYSLEFQIESLNGTKEDAKMLFGEVLKGMKSIGG